MASQRIGAEPPAPNASQEAALTVLRRFRLLVTVALALVVMIEIPWTSPRGPIPTAPPTGPLLTFRTDATAAQIGDAGAQLLESYGAYRVARGPAMSLNELAFRGRHAEQLARASVLELVNGPVDVKALVSRRPVWTLDATGHAIGVVHFHAPIKAEWGPLLEGSGATVLRYLPQDAFVVRGSPHDLEALSSLPFVDWVGPFDPSWKMRADMPTTGSVDVRIVVFPGEAPEGIEAWLAHHGVPGGDGGVLGSFGSSDFRWVRAEITAGLLRSLADLPTVEFIDVVERVHALNAQTDWVIQTNHTFSNGTGDYRYWWYGLDARGQVIGMADTGLDYDGASFRHSTAAITIGDIYNTTDMSRRKVVRYLNMGVLTEQITWPGGGGPWDPWSIKDCDHGHGTGVASTLAGNDNGLGSSPNDGDALQGKIYLEDVGGFQGLAVCPNEGLIYLPENYENLFGPPGLVYNDPAAPVRVHSNSWGADTNVYDVQARMVDAFVWAHPDMTILFAAGNCVTACGPGSVGTPATAKDIVSVGGAWNPDTGGGLDQNDLAPQSARGPASDGRIEPTIVTIFDGDSAMSDGDPLSGTGLADAHWAGTSYATPAASAAAAIIRQYFVDGWYPAARPVPANVMNPSAALVRAMLIASGAQVTGSGTVARSSADTWPNNEQGFGRVLLSNVLPIAAAGDTFRTQVVDGTDGLLTGDEGAYTFHVAVPGRIKFVLAWNDYPGTLGAAKTLINDLDLLVTAPDGTVYRGNNFAPFAQGQSLAGGTFDTTNVEEAVILKNAIAGDWKVRVIGSNVPVGPQPFALVASGSLDPSYGRVTLDRVAYSEADTIRIAVDDPAASSAVVHITSGIEPAGENVSLTRAVPDELWRGTIGTAFGTAAPDGVLQVREGDTITAAYQDSSPPHTSTALAHVLASGPTIHDVRATDIGTFSASLRWATDVPASGEVRYGTSPDSLNLNARAPSLLLDHAITLSSLSPDTVYYFAIESRTRLGNATTDSNGGLAYAFRTAPLGDVLLVIGGDSFPPEREASYAAALNDNAWTWSLWRVADLGLPPLALLQSRRAVIWQVGLEQYPPFNASSRSLVKAYLDGGGRLLVSSHDSAWALASPDSTFSTPETVAWVGGVLKATFDCDPLSIGAVKGVNGDPISGAYGAGVPYTPHRDGGADDQFAPVAAGGTATTVWTDSQVVSPSPPAPQCQQNRPDALRWVSSSANVTSGVGVWSGTPSRLVYFAFELTSVDSTLTNLNLGSTTRAAILDASLRWLVSASATTLDRDHPDVAITSPPGGVFSGSSIAVAWSATAYGSGVGIAGFTLESSADGGQTWTTIATPLPGDRSFTWDIRAVPNGDRYLLRIRAQDDGTPSLSAADSTDTTFAIERPGGDADGPILWAGSVRVDPRPPGAGFLTTFTATADDRARGGSGIAAAELFLQTPAPIPTDSGTGLAMIAVDGAFDSSVENVSWQGDLAVGVGSTCAWIDALDTSGNWGPFMSTCFPVIFATDQPPIVSIQSPMEGQTFAAASIITFAWTMSDDLVPAAQLPVWANVTIANATTPLVTGAAGVTSVTWTAPDIEVAQAVFHLDVVDPSGLRGSLERTFSLTRQSAPPPQAPSSLAIGIAAIIVLVLVAFLILGMLLARKKENQPRVAPAPPPAPPIGLPGIAPATKMCPRCGTTVNAIDVTCFYCGYAFQQPPGGPT
ncbi:MAG TPA: S8 family serine peptidase [Thermoplasmata archaeon]